MLSGIAFPVYEWSKCAFVQYRLLLVEGINDKMRNIYPLNPRFILPFAFLLAVSLLAVSLLFMLPVGSLHAQTPDDAIEYPENGTGAAATFTAIDPEQTAIMSWSLTGTDSGLFSIENGSLAFKKSPDFEMPGDILGTDQSTAAAKDNMYEVTVQATDSTGQVGMEMITVEVTNVDEPGKVTLTAVQPQSATQLTATLTDPDSITIDNPTGSITDDLTWQWAKASSRNGTYGNITGATSGSYTPTDGDIGSYLRATASYTDPEDSGKSAMATSEYAVQEIRATNRAPRFGASPPIKVAENTPAGTAIGNPVVARDDDGDKLTYTLVTEGDNAADAAFFDINWTTGQLMTKEALDFEDPDNTDDSYTVTVKATDPAGVPLTDVPNSDTVPVTITVTDVNEAPDVTGQAAGEGGNLTFAEVAANPEAGETSGVITGMLHSYQEDNPENDVDSIWSVSGADAGKFSIDDEGVLTFKATVSPDYEMPGDANRDNTYEVTVVAADIDGNRGTMDVKVMVNNVGENGTVALSRTRPRVGVPVKATLTDPDGSISGLTWQWYRSQSITSITNISPLPETACVDATSNDCPIAGARSDTYTPVTGDATKTLTAVATYTDGHGPRLPVTQLKRAVGATANVVAVDTRNRPPAFVDQNTSIDGIQNESTTKKVEENSAAVAADDAADADADAADNVGSAVMAEDPDPNEDTLIYTLSGADAGLFRVSQDDPTTQDVDEGGQIEVGAGTELDYETRTTYMVTLIAEDTYGANASIAVTIMVTDMDEMPDVTGNATTEYAENGTGSVATFTATDPERTRISWSLMTGDDSVLFNIASGVLTFKESPNFEETGTDNMYSVTVQATDATNRMGTKTITVKVTNVDESGKVSLSALRPQSGVVLTATLTDPDSVAADNTITTGVTWQWAKAGSRNGTYGNISGSGATTDSYTPVAGDIGSYLRATASYTDPEGSGKSARMNSEYAVQAERTLNADPMFADDQTTIMRSVVENTPAGMAIGNPVVATDTDGDILTYTLEGAGAVSFDINWATGQIMTKAPLNADVSDGGTASYSVTVRATDPGDVPGNNAAADNTATVSVIITVTDVNEAPDVGGEALVMFEEVTGEIATPLDTYVAPDPENDIPIVWSLSGADASKFSIDDGSLEFMAKPDYEMSGDANGDNTYEVTVVATDTMGNGGTMDVKVMVTNEDEGGTVTLSRTQPRVGVPLMATLTDPDGSISGLRWQWYRGNIGDQTAIANATSDTYKPTAADATNIVQLLVRASYTDGHGAGKMTESSPASAVAVDTRNRPPAFEDQDTDTDGIQNESTTREVQENTKSLAGTADDDDAEEDNALDNVDNAVMAKDPDPNEDPLIYTLSGADASLFRVRDDGQIEVDTGTKLDYETKDTYMVTLNAEDSFGDSASIVVTIMVTDMDEKPTIMAVDNEAPAMTVRFGSATYTAMEGGSVTVRVTLSPAPRRSVSIPITKSNQGTTINADYSGVPASVTFGAGVRSKTFSFTAVDDTDTDDESVSLSFGTLPTGVSTGTPGTTTVNITDNDDPAMRVSFSQGAYSVTEGSDVTVMVTLSAAPEGTVIIPLTKTNQSGASDADYSGVPANVTFNSGETSQTFSFTAVDDTDDDDSESVRLSFGTLPTDVSAGTVSTATVSITDNDEDGMAPVESLLERYDDDISGHIDRAEAVQAVRDYQGGELTRAEAVQVIRLYQAGPQ